MEWVVPSCRWTATTETDEDEYLTLSFTLQMDACFLTRSLWLKWMECCLHSREPSSATLPPSTTCTGRTWRRDSGTSVFIPVLDFKPSFWGLIPSETWFDCVLQPELKWGSKNEGEVLLPEASCLVQNSVHIFLHSLLYITHTSQLIVFSYSCLANCVLRKWPSKLFYMNVQVTDSANKPWTL